MERANNREWVVEAARSVGASGAFPAWQRLPGIMPRTFAECEADLQSRAKTRAARGLMFRVRNVETHEAVNWPIRT
jgi:hypothetical protein